MLSLVKHFQLLIVKIYDDAFRSNIISENLNCLHTLIKFV
jgi:hypothetical protein